MSKVILDISHHQVPEKINYDLLAPHISLAIVRTQYGSLTVDRHYKTHHAEFRKRGVPTHAYAWVRGSSIHDMEVEAKDFYDRTKEFNPEVWWLDVEEISMDDMRNGISAYVKKLRELGARKVGAYIAHHFYTGLNLNVAEFDAVWIPHYGANNGVINSKPKYPCDLHQYTSVGRLPGYNSNLDLNFLTGSKPLEFFLGTEKAVEPQPVAQPAAPEQTNSIVDYLNSIKADSSFANRAKLAKQYGIGNYSGTAGQNTQLLNLIRSGAAPKPAQKGNMKTTSIVDYLNSIGVNSSFSNRKKLAAQHGIGNYAGTAAQNTQLLKKLRG